MQESVPGRKDKKVIEGEVFDDARIRGFLNVLPPTGMNADFHVLEVAYRGMTPESFIRFIPFFREAGRDLNAKNPQGETLLDVLTRHRHGAEYLVALQG
jgi:hypothetical protein